MNKDYTLSALLKQAQAETDPPLAPQPGMFESLWSNYTSRPMWQKVMLGGLAAGTALGATGAATLGILYLSNPAKFRRKARTLSYDALQKMEDNLKPAVDKLPEGTYGGFDPSGTLSLSGPGLMVHHDKAPALAATGHLTGGGLALRFTRNGLADALEYVPFVNKRFIRNVRKMGPPSMYAGLDISLLNPVSAGMEISRGNAEQVLDSLRHMRKGIDPDRYKRELKKQQTQGGI